MIKKTKEKANNLRNNISKGIKESEIPIIVYGAVIISMIVVWMLRIYNEDIAFNFLAELFGAAFTLFIIDVLLVRSKRKRWKVVRKDIDYLIARNVNRLRDGISLRVFNFKPKLKQKLSQKESLFEERKQRNLFLEDLSKLNINEIIKKIKQKEIFTEDNYYYFNEKANEIWEILNMRYSEYLQPELVSLLIELHTKLKDLSSHIRQYKKTKYYDNEKMDYKKISLENFSINLKQILLIVNKLEKEGYSEPADLSLNK